MAANCSRCGVNPPRPNQRYCKTCHATHMRETRPKYKDLSRDAKKKSNAGAQARVAVRRRMLQKKPCRNCGADAEMHHEDYDRPLKVDFLCRKCHLERHRELNNEEGVRVGYAQR
jgi:hypothetical protein